MALGKVFVKRNCCMINNKVKQEEEEEIVYLIIAPWPSITFNLV